jgi:hypothetical protein
MHLIDWLEIIVVLTCSVFFILKVDLLGEQYKGFNLDQPHLCRAIFMKLDLFESKMITRYSEKLGPMRTTEPVKMSVSMRQ